MPEQLTDAIAAELAQAIRKLGGDPAGVNLADPWQVNRVLEFLGADIYLLATIGSWKDTMNDEETLAELKEWNERGPDAIKGTSFVG